jgi:DNA-binding NarL/FixJ family response regulator
MKNKIDQAAPKIRVMVVDDHAGMREALRRVIDSEPNLIVVAAAEDGRSAVDLFRRIKPDVVLMDGSMPEMSGIETTYQLKKVQPSVKVIALTLYEESTYLEEMIAAGASGYVLKTGRTEKLMQAIRAVAAGDTYFDKAVLRRSSATSQERRGVEQLNAEELAVAKRLADGHTNAEIAADFNLSVPVVEKHRAAVMKKLNVRSRADLVRIAAQRKWLTT